MFNMWYFGWFDDAMTQFFGELGYPYTAMNADGFDVQLVHTEADWRDAVRYGEQVAIDVTTERLGLDQFHAVVRRAGRRPAALDRPHGLRRGGHGRLGQADRAAQAPRRPRGRAPEQTDVS